MKRHILSLAILLASGLLSGQSQLQPGDIAILGYQTDNPDEFSFLALKEIESGTSISFTDNGWNGSALTSNEGTFVWTATSNISRGTVVNVLPTSVAFSTSGDQIIAYQGTSSAPNFIYALTSNAWVTGTIASTTSRLPAGLSNGTTAVSFASEQDNGFFNQTSASGSREELLALIGNSSNWTRSASRYSSFPNWNIQVVVPQPPSGGGGNEGSVLSQGDIAILSFNYDNPDQFSFIQLVHLTAGTEINFTDAGWNGTSLLASENVFTWTASADYPAGTVHVINSPAGLAFGTGGDQIIAFTGEKNNPELIYAFSSRPWVSGSISSATSRLPAGMSNFSLAFPNEIDNGFCNVSSFSGSKSEALALIQNVGNWTRSNGRISTLPSWNYQIEGGTPVNNEPSGPATNPVFSSFTTWNGTFSFSPAGGDVESYLVLRSTNAPSSAMPQDGVSYTKGDYIGNAVVISAGTETNVVQEALRASTTYHYSVYSAKNTAQGINYLQNQPLSAVFTTQASMAGGYYTGIDPQSQTFINDLQVRVQVPYTRVDYGQYDETIVARFEFRDTTGGLKVQECAYTGEIYTYQPPFVWYTNSPFSREHTWPVSWMPSGGSASSIEYSDLHHLLTVVQNNANSVRSNHPLGNVTVATNTYLDAKAGFDNAGNYVYEPRNEIKGDVARSILYTVLRYNGVNGNDWTIEYLNNTILPALNVAPQNLITLINWHFSDLPDSYEMARNDFIQSVQQNRNPFVDHPEWVNLINFNNLSLNGSQARLSGNTENTEVISTVLFPNPSNGEAFIRIADASSARIEMYSMDGKQQEVSQDRLNEHLVRLDAMNIQPGIYYVRIFSSDGNMKTLKWIKK